MQENSPSVTALRVAALRALHQSVDVPPIFVDPMAVRVLGAQAGELLAHYGERAGETARLRGTLAARAMIAEEAVAEAFDRGVRQYVILGAGLDTFAYRQPHAELRVFELDHPATQGWKREMLHEAGIEVPASVTYVAIHFERHDLFETLAGGGFDRRQPAIFVMLGVVPYVEQESILKTFGEIAANGAPGTEIVFDYTEPFANAPAKVRADYQAVATRVAAGGEPWVTFLEPAPLRVALRERGFAEVTDIDAKVLSKRFCAGRTDGLTIAPLVHLVRART